MCCTVVRRAHTCCNRQKMYFGITLGITSHVLVLLYYYYEFYSYMKLFIIYAIPSVISIHLLVDEIFCS